MNITDVGERHIVSSRESGMRFDPASALYAEFGPFFVGLQFAARELPRLLEGEVPSL